MKVVVKVIWVYYTYGGGNILIGSGQQENMKKGRNGIFWNETKEMIKNKGIVFVYL